MFLLPTASDDLLGVDEWGAGPTCSSCASRSTGPIGALINRIWSAPDRATIRTSATPSCNRSSGNSRADPLTFNLESTYDWENEQWTVPINVMYSKVTRVGSQTMSFAGGVRGDLDAPRGGPDWGLRFVGTFLSPET